MEARDTSPLPDPLDDTFMTELIDAVQRNQCVYNRYDPLHKISDFKHEVWKMISHEIHFDGHPVELERKWRHMRDKYVRLRKQEKLSAPIRKTNKWYNFYKKMSFLDPHIEHRKRKRKEEEVGYFDHEIEEHDLQIRKVEEDLFDIKPEAMETYTSNDAFHRLYETMLKDQPMTQEVKVETPQTSHCSPSSSSSPFIISSQVDYSTTREIVPIEIEEQDYDDETEVSLFVGSISKCLSSMDRKTFSVARVEISKILYECQFGSLKPPSV